MAARPADATMASRPVCDYDRQGLSQQAGSPSQRYRDNHSRARGWRRCCRVWNPCRRAPQRRRTYGDDLDDLQTVFHLGALHDGARGRPGDANPDLNRVSRVADTQDWLRWKKSSVNANPSRCLVGGGRFELPTNGLKVLLYNQLVNVLARPHSPIHANAR